MNNFALIGASGFVAPRHMDAIKKCGGNLICTFDPHDNIGFIDNYFPEIVRPKAASVGPQIGGTFGKAYKKGVKIAFGTDVGVQPHGTNWKEFVYMNQYGMPAIETIVAATIETAKLLGESDTLGSISVGKIADIIAISGNPLEAFIIIPLSSILELKLISICMVLFE